MKQNPVDMLNVQIAILEAVVMLQNSVVQPRLFFYKFTAINNQRFVDMVHG
jgi:hypothetical protein